MKIYQFLILTGLLIIIAVHTTNMPKGPTLYADVVGLLLIVSGIVTLGLPVEK